MPLKCHDLTPLSLSLSLPICIDTSIWKSIIMQNRNGFSVVLHFTLPLISKFMVWLQNRRNILNWLVLAPIATGTGCWLPDAFCWLFYIINISVWYNICNSAELNTIYTMYHIHAKMKIGWVCFSTNWNQFVHDFICWRARARCFRVVCIWETSSSPFDLSVPVTDMSF